MLSLILFLNLLFFSLILIALTRAPEERISINTMRFMVVVNAFGLLYSL